MNVTDMAINQLKRDIRLKFKYWDEGFQVDATRIGKEHFEFWNERDAVWEQCSEGEFHSCVCYKLKKEYCIHPSKYSNTFTTDASFWDEDPFCIEPAPATLREHLIRQEEQSMKAERVIFNGPATIVFWKDGTKTIVKCSVNDRDDSEKAFLMAFFQKQTGMSKTQIAKVMKEHCGS